MKLFALSLVGLLATAGIHAQENNHPVPLDAKVTVLTPDEFRITQGPNMLFNKETLENKIAEIERDKRERAARPERKFVYSVADGAQYGNDPASIQTIMGTRSPLAPIKKWNGQSGNGSSALDPSGSQGNRIINQEDFRDNQYPMQH